MRAATSALDRLYALDTPEALKDCLTAFTMAVKGSYTLADKSQETDLLDAILTGEKSISPELYQRYADNFRRAVDAVPIDNPDLSAQWHANVSRFAAYKAYHATNELRRAAEEEDGDMALLKAILHKYNRYQAAEYNTAVARARTGKQWQHFSEGDNVRLFPNIKWLPSRSATPREEHRPFYGKVWAKDDTFWTYNQPGTLWNCKCDWEQTDEPVTNGNPTSQIVKPGLDQNPAISGQIFTDTAPYFQGVSKTKAKRIAECAADANFRQESIANARTYQGTSTEIDLNGSNIEVVFDSKTTKHIANDIFESKDFLRKEISAHLPDVLRRSELVAHEPNVKLDKKPSVLHYYYYKFDIAGRSYYLHVEENFVEREKRHFYRLYSITDKLREGAIMY